MILLRSAPLTAQIARKIQSWERRRESQGRVRIPHPSPRDPQDTSTRSGPSMGATRMWATKNSKKKNFLH
jgi:hypothetical protein